MKKILLVVALTMIVSGCGAVNTVSSVVTGRPTEYRFDDGVRCYYSQSGSLSCVVVK